MATARLLSGPRLGLGLLALLVLLGGGRGSARADEDMPLRVATAPYRGTVVDGKTGRAYGAKTTPHMFIINKGTLVYAGAIDDSGGRNEAKKNYVSTAIDELLAGKDVSTTSTKAFGCSVKYKH